VEVQFSASTFVVKSPPIANLQNVSGNLTVADENYFYIGLCIILSSCNTKNSVPKEVSKYLTETFDLLEENSVYKNEIDWKEFKSDVKKKVSNAKKIEDTYPAIAMQLKSLMTIIATSDL
jgi:hypothetical protein